MSEHMGNQIRYHASPKGVVVISAYEAKLYANTAALKAIRDKLSFVEDADPNECFELHFGSVFRENGSYTVIFEDDVKEALDQIREKGLASFRTSDPANVDAEVADFEITVMHVTEAALDEMASRG